ncbi:MAG: 2'-5' RNA ligase family protein [Cyanobacteria bacterium CRU_2_1]|nr:2'-5' RNA ligase family protein [Cyanobacteria bacterium RU_5_0]NJR57874.1 2'-5' RNA ligase family protein [Cyanobacteria bacterium CRU_2_1]
MSTGEKPSVRFFIALMPPDEIQDYANQAIEALSDRYHTRTAKAPPHITLQPPFLWQPDATQQLEMRVNEFARRQAIVPVTLSGFGAFAPRVLYINVLKTPELLTLQANLMNYLEETLGIVDPTTKQRGFSPHLTIASRNLTRQTFKQAWADLQTRHVEFEYVSDRLTLLIYDGHCWHIQSEFPCVG